MNTPAERLNRAIDNLQADRSPYTGLEAAPHRVDTATEAELFRAAAHLKSLRPGANLPDPNFVAQLRARLSGGTTPTS